MGFMNRLFGGKAGPPPAELLGCWQLVPSTSDAEPAEAEFRDDGQLFYSVLSDGRWQIMKLRYEVDGQILVTDQPSAPRKERTAFSFGGDGKLTLELGGERSVFKRGPKVAPAV
jgi:hypothetical protein